MKCQLVLLFFLFCLLTACKNSKSKDTHTLDQPNSILRAKEIESSVVDLEDKLSSQMKDKVRLDTLMRGITRQENVRVITELKENWNDTTKIRSYSSGKYHFELKIINQATTFKDGATKINFNDCSLTCQSDSIFKCEDYGFKVDNTLIEPQIIDVRGHVFLYSEVSYWCNGIGCGCFITFIYDFIKKKATFLENYRIPFDGFFLSDFDNDNNPDLLVISQTNEREMKGFKFEEFDTKLSWFYYDNGEFKPKINRQFQRPYSYYLYSFTSGYHHSYHDGLIYSITENNWPR